MPDDAKVVALGRPDLAWAKFVLARHKMNLLFQAWVTKRKDIGCVDEDIQEEIDGTTATLNQLRDMILHG